MAELLGVRNAVQLREYFEEPRSGASSACWLFSSRSTQRSASGITFFVVTELLAGGDLLSAVQERGSLAEEDARRAFASLMQACSGMRKRGVIHRDIKLDNVLLSSFIGDISSAVKLADFVGLATRISPDRPPTKVCGTPSTVAPEILVYGSRRLSSSAQQQGAQRPALSTTYGPECDVWSCGVALYTMLSGAQPFSGATIPDLYRKIKRGQYDFRDPAFEMVSDSALDLICRCLTVDPAARITPEEALRHPWVTAA